jgi:hypothetical protein
MTMAKVDKNYKTAIMITQSYTHRQITNAISDP